MSTLSDRAAKARLILERAKKARLNLSASFERVKKRQVRVETRIEKIERRERLKRDIENHRAWKAHIRDVKLVDKQDYRQRLLNSMYEDYRKRENPTDYMRALEDAIARDVGAVAEAQARIIMYVDPEKR